MARAGAICGLRTLFSFRLVIYVNRRDHQLGPVVRQVHSMTNKFWSFLCIYWFHIKITLQQCSSDKRGLIKIYCPLLPNHQKDHKQPSIHRSDGHLIYCALLDHWSFAFVIVGFCKGNFWSLVGISNVNRNNKTIIYKRK